MKPEVQAGEAVGAFTFTFTNTGGNRLSSFRTASRSGFTFVCLIGPSVSAAVGRVSYPLTVCDAKIAVERKHNECRVGYRVGYNAPYVNPHLLTPRSTPTTPVLFQGSYTIE